MTYQAFWQSLQQVYDEGEAKAVARYALESLFGLSMTDIVCGAVEQLPPHDEQRLLAVRQRLTKGEPVQYVVGTVRFGSLNFKVAPGVLIPRPETYELCQWVMADWTEVGLQRETCSLLDIGTGSGCIACTLAGGLPKARVTAWDISADALRIAQQNAESNQVGVNFQLQDVLQAVPPSAPQWDVIVSNPPYICQKEAASMESNVLAYEPHEALFVPDDNPLLFYCAIATYACSALKAGGRLYFELNPLYAEDCRRMLELQGFCHLTLRQDEFGKQRFIKAIKE
jgi:release factor glutamine methyltransferase